MCFNLFKEIIDCIDVGSLSILPFLSSALNILVLYTYSICDLTIYQMITL